MNKRLWLAGLLLILAGPMAIGGLQAGKGSPSRRRAVLLTVGDFNKIPSDLKKTVKLSVGDHAGREVEAYAASAQTLTYVLDGKVWRWTAAGGSKEGYNFAGTRDYWGAFEAYHPGLVMVADKGAGAAAGAGSGSSDGATPSAPAPARVTLDLSGAAKNAADAINDSLKESSTRPRGSAVSEPTDASGSGAASTHPTSPKSASTTLVPASGGDAPSTPDSSTSKPGDAGAGAGGAPTNVVTKAEFAEAQAAQAVKPLGIVKQLADYKASIGSLSGEGSGSGGAPSVPRPATPPLPPDATTSASPADPTALPLPPSCNGSPTLSLGEGNDPAPLDDAVAESSNDDESDDEQGSQGEAQSRDTQSEAPTGNDQEVSESQPLSTSAPAAGPVGMTVPAQVDPAAKPQQLLANVQAAMSECKGFSRDEQIKKLLEIRACLEQIKELVLQMDDNLEGPAIKEIEQEIAETEEALNKAGVDDASGDEDGSVAVVEASRRSSHSSGSSTALDPNASPAPAAPKGITKKVNATTGGSGEAERPTIVRAGRAATLSQDPINGVRTAALTASFAAGCVPIGFGAKDLIQLLRSKVAKGDRTKVMIRGIGLVSLGLVWEAANIWMLAEGMHRAPATAKPVAKS